jgi:hypothetical protein
MKSHVKLLPAQRREVNERIRAAFKAGYNMGCESACLFNLVALNNLHVSQILPLFSKKPLFGNRCRFAANL